LVEEGERSIATLLRVVIRHQLLEPSASSKIVLQRNINGQIRARIQSATPLAIVTLHEGMLEHPIRTTRRSVEAASGAVAGGMDPVASEEVYLCYDAGDVDAWEVTHAAAIIRGGLELRELVLGDLSAADGVVVVGVASWEDVDVGVGVVVLVTDAEAAEGAAEDGGGEEEGG